MIHFSNHINQVGGEVDLWFFPSYILVYTQPRSSICKPTIIKLSLQLFQMKYLLLDTISMELRCPFSIHKQINSWAIPTGNNSTGFVPCLLFHGYVILKRSHGRFEPLQDKGIVPEYPMEYIDWVDSILTDIFDIGDVPWNI